MNEAMVLTDHINLLEAIVRMAPNRYDLLMAALNYFETKLNQHSKLYVLAIMQVIHRMFKNTAPYMFYKVINNSFYNTN